MSGRRAMIAMSGGVDSAMAACLMKEAGYDCTGVMMKLYDSGAGAACSDKSCCTEEDAQDARSVAAKLGIPFYVFNFQDEFEDAVIRPFAESYIRGETPNPCIDCNRKLKFERLMRRMKELEFDYLATGHYARVEYDPADGRYHLKKGLDESKDQSYVLYDLTQEQLAHIKFPLGTRRKAEIRELAQKHGFRNAKKRDSQDICFVPDGDYASFIEKYCGHTFPQGDFISEDGRILGTHKGMIRYTIGQRRGLGVPAPERLYVCRKDPEHNQIVLGPAKSLGCRVVFADRCSWIGFREDVRTVRCRAKIRYKHPEAPAVVTRLSDSRMRVEFDEPQRGIAPGQAIVLYDGDEVLGGGRIEKQD